MASRVIRQLEKREDSRGATYSIIYEVQASDLSNFNLKYGADAKWFTYVDSYVYDHTINTFAPNYVVKIMACSADYNWGGGSGTYAIKQKTTVEKSFTVKEYIMQPSFFGVHRATPQEAGFTTDSNNKSGTLTPKKKLLDGTPCDIGDWIFDNSTADDKGSASYAQFPFNEDQSFSDSQIDTIVGQNVTTTIYTISFSTNKPINAFESWAGVNGEWGADMAPLTTMEKAWLSIGQECKEYWDNGVKWHRVSRHMMKAPKMFNIQLTWKSEIYGTWSW